MLVGLGRCALGLWWPPGETTPADQPRDMGAEQEALRGRKEGDPGWNREGRVTRAVSEGTRGGDPRGTAAGHVGP